MDNILIENQSWFKKNWKWFIPLTGIVLFLTISLLIIAFSSVLGNYSKAYADPKLYELALEKVRQNDRVNEVLGEIQPIDNMTILNGSVNYSDDNKIVNSTIKITCKKGKAMLDISAELNNDTWNYKKITVRIKNPVEKKETIEILNLIEE
ncbi:cytochrome c oxidase assembly factor Coa1 family protein [Flavobacterium gelidilacus]|uniref:cytochrome c oxidase assembly factor Coa1 family protein n=1 Tax=Flavobacterium gelidilacus TaxID=206041 RepID=UPI00041754C3|nr:cytochrome c oxidase assembly factor Coa1 family protein [Flavobacterium gelidilacus]